jgi:tripartite-type tricarboxylate transporter receptor subunit TctC
MTEAGPEEVLGKVVFNADYRLDEFQPIFGWFINAFNLYVPKTSTIKTFEDFVKTARSRRVTVATLGKGGPSHLQFAILRDRLKLDLQFVHFDGGAPAYAAVAGGHVEAGMGGATSVQWADTINFLAVFRADRDPAIPDAPTPRELGHDLQPINEIIYANAGPGVPADRMAKLEEAFTKAFADPEHIAQQRKINVDVKPIKSAEVRQLVQKAFELATQYKSVLAE